MRRKNICTFSYRCHLKNIFKPRFIESVIVETHELRALAQFLKQGRNEALILSS